MKGIRMYETAEKSPDLTGFLMLLPFSCHQTKIGDIIAQISSTYFVKIFHLPKQKEEVRNMIFECQQEFRELAKIEMKTQEYYNSRIRTLAKVDPVNFYKQDFQLF